MAKEDLYIALLRYGKENLSIGRTYNELKKHLEDQGHEFTDGQLKRIFSDAYEFPVGLGALPNGGSYRILDDRIKHNVPHLLTLAAYFQLLEYQELTEARKTSRLAMVISIGAVVLTLVIGIASLLLAASDPEFQTLDPVQLEQLLGVLRESQ